jgi:hypothetical protein
MREAGGYLRSITSMSVSLWLSLLKEASSADGVVILARDYLATWTPADLARLPEESRPGRIRDSDDVSYWAYVLMKQHCDAPVTGPGAVLFEQMLSFFTHASEQLTVYLEAPPPRPHEDGRGGADPQA